MSNIKQEIAKELTNKFSQSQYFNGKEDTAILASTINNIDENGNLVISNEAFVKLVESPQLKKKFKTIARFFHPSGKDVTVNFLIGDYGSHTNGKDIQVSISKRFLNTLTADELYIMLKAIFVHELEHNISSDFEDFKSFIKEVSEYCVTKFKVSANFGRKLAIAYMNGTEDGRIERIAGQRVVKYAEILRMNNLFIWEAQPLTAQHDELSVFLHQIVSFAVLGAYQKNFSDFYDDTHEMVQTLKKMEPIIEQIKYTNIAKEVKPLCWELIYISEDYLAKKIKENKEKAEQSMQNQKDQPDFSGGQGEDFDEENSEGGKQQGQGQDGQGQGQEGEGQQGSGSAMDDSDYLEDDKKDQKGKSSGDGEEQEGEEKDGQGSGSDSKDGEEDENGSSKSKDGKDKDENSSDKGKDGKDGKDSKDGKDGKDSKDGKDGDSSDADGDSKSKNKKNKDDKNKEDGESESSAEGDGDKKSSKMKENKNKETADEMQGDSQGKRLTASELEKAIQEEIEANKKRVKEEAAKELSSIQKAKNKEDKQAEKENAPIVNKKEIDKMVDKYYKDDYNNDFKQVRRKNFAGFVNERMDPTLLSEAKKYKRKITAMLEEESQALRNLDVGRLDVRDLHKLASGRVNVFSQTELPQVKTAVAFALDGSGSMYGTPERELRKMMSVFEEIFIESCKMNIQIFSTTGNSVVHHVVKEWDDEPKQNYNYSYNGLYARGAGGGNKDGYSIRMMVKELEMQEEETKILFVLSDGLPSCYSGGSKAGMSDVNSAVREAKRKGIVVIPIMFGDRSFLVRNKPAFQAMYGGNIIATEREKILPQLVKIMKKLL